MQGSLTPTQVRDHRPLIIAGIVLGLGQGGFFDGIVFHQLLQWHHMFSEIAPDTTIGGLQLNTIGDGLFHLLDWLLTLTGLGLLWRAVIQQVVLSTTTLLGSILMGMGLFNLVEGLIDHHLFGIHHVKPGLHQTAYDLAFLGVGVLLCGVGWRVITATTKDLRSHL